MSEELKACPFCRSRDVQNKTRSEYDSNGPDYFYLAGECDECGARGPESRYNHRAKPPEKVRAEKESNAARNTRHADTQLAEARAENERLRVWLKAWQTAFNQVDDLMEYRGMDKAQFAAIAEALNRSLVTTQAAGDGDGAHIWGPQSPETRIIGCALCGVTSKSLKAKESCNKGIIPYSPVRMPRIANALGVDDEEKR